MGLKSKREDGQGMCSGRDNGITAVSKLNTENMAMSRN